MSGIRYYTDQHLKRMYFSNQIRTTCIALISKTNDKFPWETDSWQNEYPELSKFLSNQDSEYGKTEEDYNKILYQYSILAHKNKWLNQYSHEFADKDIIEYLPSKSFAIKDHKITLAFFVTGLIIGWWLL